MDNHAEVYARPSDTVIGTLKGHTKRLTAALWLGPAAPTAAIITASADKSVRVWAAKPANAEEGADVRAMGWAKKAIVKHHKAEVVGLALHPSAKYFASAAADGQWAIHDAEAGSVVVSGSVDAPLSQVAYHPDGAFLGLGTADGSAKILDVRQQQVLATLPVGEGPVTGLHFSENGYHFATTTKEEVAVWDLRKQTKTHAWSLADLSAEAFADARFDASGKYLAVAATAAVHVFRVKGWLSLAVLPCADTVNALQWIGHLSTGLAVACLENSVHIYEPSSSL
ncbi:hypothetical protein FBU31_007443 [Coemansia sp. 'formosensis']|nr:hypothetical protein FBU31_007443 [Coemansia sp. 'formosensis']